MDDVYLSIGGEWIVTTSFYKTKILTVGLIYAVLDFLEERYGYTEITETDFLRIADSADFLVTSYQVASVEDFNLSAIYECLNDTDLAEDMMERESAKKQFNRKEEPKKR